LLCAKKFITLIVIVVAQLVSLSLFLLLLMLLQFAETFAEATPRRGVLYYAATFIIMMEKEAKSGKKRFTIMQYLGTFVTLYSRVKAFPTRGYCVFINCALTHGEPNDETPVRRAISSARSVALSYRAMIIVTGDRTLADSIGASPKRDRAAHARANHRRSGLIKQSRAGRK